MSVVRRCPSGHQWESPVEGSACPVCGSAENPTKVDPLATAVSVADHDAATTLPSASDTPAATSPRRSWGEDTQIRHAEVPGFEIVRELGRGGMGVVYQARQTRLDRMVALKMILGAGHAGEAQLARFRTEAEAIARLQHPGIVQIFEAGDVEGLPYLVLEFCPGGNLAHRLAGTPMVPAAAAELVEHLARAMETAHAKGIIHRDLKPANVLLAEDGTAKVTDFGLAKKVDEVGQTQSGSIIGTPSYMSPEQASGQAGISGPSCDVYALGAILYECLTGRPPFRAATAIDTVLQVLKDEAVSPSRLCRGIPRDLEIVCLHCLRKDPADRYPTAAELADDLRRFREGLPVKARPVPWWERLWKWTRRRPAAAALLLVSLLAVCGVTATALAYNRRLELENDRFLKERDAARKAEELARFQRKKALANLRQAMDAVDRFLTRVGETRTLFVERGEEARAAFFRDALEFCRKFVDEQRDDLEAVEEVGVTLMRQGKILRSLRRYEEAAKTYQETIAFWNTSAAKDVPEDRRLRHLAETHYLLGHLYRYGLPDSARANGEYARAADILQPTLGRDSPDPDNLALYGWCLHDLGALAMEMGQAKDAEEKLRKALAVRLSLVKNEPGKNEFRWRLAQTRGTLGLLFHNLHHLEDAAAEMNPTRDDLIDLLKKEPRSTDYASDLGLILINLGNLQADRKENDAAEASYRRAAGIFEGLLAEVPGQPTFLHRRGMALHNLGDLAMDRDRFDEAETWLNRALATNRELVAHAPNYPPGLQALALDLLNLGDLHQKRNRLEPAEKAAREAQAGLMKLAAGDPANLGYILDQGKSHFLLALILTRKKDLPSALEECRRAEALFTRVLDRIPGQPLAATFRSKAVALRRSLESK